MSDKYDTTEKVEETERGYRLKITSTRGTGTRDEDTVKVEARTETKAELEDQREELVGNVVSTMRELRMVQPDTDE